MIFSAFCFYITDVLLESIDEYLILKYKISYNILKSIQIYSQEYKMKDHLNYYSVNLKQIILKSTYSLLTDMAFKISDFIDINICYNGEDIQTHSQEVFKIIRLLKENSKKLLLGKEYIEKIENIFEIFSESYSDLFAILLLNVNEEFYLNCILKSYSVNKINEINDDFLSMRLISNFIANDFDIEYLKGRNNTYQQLERYLKYQKCSYGSSVESLSSTFENPAILKCLIEYLKCCKDSYSKVYKTKPFDDLQDLIVKNKLGIEIMEKYINELRKSIYDDLKTLYT